MRSAKSVGRSVGVLLLLHLAAGLTAPCILLQAVLSPPGFLTHAAGSPDRVRAAVMLRFVGRALAVGTAATGPIPRQPGFLARAGSVRGVPRSIGAVAPLSRTALVLACNLDSMVRRRKNDYEHRS